MADHAMLLSAFNGREVGDLPHQSKPAKREMEMAFADNECAHALLLLATAATQVSLPDNTHGHSGRKRKLHGTADRRAANNNGVPQQQQCCAGDSSILKRQLQGTPVKSAPRRFASMAAYDGNTAVKICENGEYLRKLLVKRIKLDHNYAFEERFKEILDNGVQQCATAGASNSTKNSNLDPSKRDVGGVATVKRSSPPERRPQKSGKHSTSSKSKASKGVASASSKPVRQNDPYGFQDDELQTPDSKDLSLHGKSAQAAPEPQPPDLYQPNDSKYKNFNLLLRCLTTEDSVGIPEEAPVLFTGRRRCNTIGSSTTTQDISGSEDGLVTDPGVIPDYNEHQCKCCFKVFSRKRYLTKHVSRMHPETDPSDSDKDETVSCPNCTHVISRRNFKRHSHMCNAHMRKSKKQLEMDLANCQFCGIRMRRHILVRHLAQEHCVENLKSATEALLRAEDDCSDTDSSTLSGSDNEDEKHSPSKDVMLCSLCNVMVPRSLIKQHVQQKHQAPSKASSSSTDTSATSASTSTSPGRRTPVRVACQLCGLELANSIALGKHLSEQHDAKAGVNGLEATPPDAPKVGSGCTHSMLQRFLSESSGDAEAMEPMDQCQSCISGLVKLATLATVNGSQRAASSSPADLTLASGAAATACVLSRGSHSSLSVAHRSTGPLQDSLSERSPLV